MNIIGLDIGRNSASACLLTEFPDQPLRHFQQHRKTILKLKCNALGVQQLLELEPDALVLEPTGVWYSAFWKNLAQTHNIPIFWIGHGDLAAQRKAYGFKNKRDDEDSYCLALCYFDPRFVDVHGRSRFLKFEDGVIAQIRDLFFEAEQIDKVLNSMINQLRQRLALEFPEICQSKSEISPKLGYSPLWGYVAGKYCYTQIVNKDRNSAARKLGIEISEYSRNHAAAICELQQRLTTTERELVDLLAAPEFESYMKVFKKFGFGVRNQSLLLAQIYPFDRFLVNGQPWVDLEEGKDKEGNPKIQKRHRSLRSFQLFLGLGYVEKQSGDKSTKALGGSEITRASLYAWVMTSVLPARRDTSYLNCRLNLDLGDQGGWILSGLKESKIGGKQKVIRILFKVSRLLFYELWNELK